MANLDGWVSRVRASDGKLLETWTGADRASGVLVAMGRVFVTGATDPGKLYMIDPTQPAGAVTTVVDNLGKLPAGLGFDGARIWTANRGASGPDSSISIVTPGAWNVITITGFTFPQDLLWDGSNMWVTEVRKLQRLDSSGSIVQTVQLDYPAYHPVFDGQNIWVPQTEALFSYVAVVRAATGEVIARLPMPDAGPLQADALVRTAAFDGERILVTDETSHRLIMWKAADLFSLGAVFIAPKQPFGVCSDGRDFWVTFHNTGELARF